MCLVKLNNITKKYPLADKDQIILNDVSLSIGKGEMVALMGASGSGKSTLMNIIGLLDLPSSGEYYLNSKLVTKQNASLRAQIRGLHIGFVFQQFYLLPKLTALENVALPLEYQGLSDEVCKNRASAMLEKVGMEDRMSYKPQALSGGQQQRVAIARALVTEPCLILADEPTGALDSENSKAVMELFQALHDASDTSFLIVTHDASVAKLCDRVLHIKDGKLLPCI